MNIQAVIRNKCKKNHNSIQEQTLESTQSLHASYFKETAIISVHAYT